MPLLGGLVTETVTSDWIAASGLVTGPFSVARSPRMTRVTILPRLSTAGSPRGSRPASAIPPLPPRAGRVYVDLNGRMSCCAITELLYFETWWAALER